MNGAIRLGRYAGVDVVADASVFLLAFAFGAAVFVRMEAVVPDASPEIRGVLATVAGVAIVGCVFLHEVSHVVVALKRGMSVRSIRLFMFGGYSVIDGVPSPRVELLVSLSGPAASIALGLSLLSVPYVAGGDNPIGATFWSLGMANLAIGVFNLLPGFPLDGGRVVRSALSATGYDRVAATRTVTLIGRYLGLSAVAIGLFLLVRRDPVGLVWIVGGWFLASSATSAGRREELSAAFDGMAVSDVMRETSDAISGDATIAILLELYAVGPRLRSIPVEMSGRVVGVIGQEEIDSVAPSRWPSMRVRALMAPIGPADLVEADAPFESLLLQPAGKSGRAVAVRDGVVVGIVDSDALTPVLSH